MRAGATVGALAWLLLAALAPAGAGAEAPREEQVLYAHCASEAGEYEGTVRARLLLHRDFLGTDDLAASVKQQLKYLWGHYRNDPAAHRALRVVLSAEAPRVEVLARKEVPYGRELALPWDHVEPHLAIEDPYTRRAVARGRVGGADPALEITYEARFKLALCGLAERPGPSLRVPLPRDPWLMYWHVPLKAHRPLRYYASRAVTNPCADNDFADLPHPFYYWYDWLPDRHGSDDEGRAFDCRELLREGVDYDRWDVALRRVGTPTGDFARLRRELGDGGTGPLTATVLIGALDHAVLDLGLGALRAALGATRGRAGAARAFAARVAQALTRWQAQPPHERGTGMFLRTLGGLGALADIEAHASAIRDGFLEVELRGRLKRSGRAVRIRLYLGLTDLFGPTPPRHFGILKKALLEEQVIVYYGHSGIGENFRLAQIERQLKLDGAAFRRELARAPFRLVAFISCYSYMYFGQDLLEAEAERNAGAVFVFTGSEPRGREEGPLSIFRLVDDVLAPAQAAEHVARLPGLGDDEFWIVKAVGTALGR